MIEPSVLLPVIRITSSILAIHPEDAFDIRVHRSRVEGDRTSPADLRGLKPLNPQVTQATTQQHAADPELSQFAAGPHRPEPIPAVDPVSGETNVLRVGSAVTQNRDIRTRDIRMLKSTQSFLSPRASP